MWRIAVPVWLRRGEAEKVRSEAGKCREMHSFWGVAEAREARAVARVVVRVVPRVLWSGL